MFDKNGRATGLMFLAQLKATDAHHLRSALQVSLKVDTVNYYRSLELPVMMVRFHSPTKKFYWRWLHEFEKRVKPGQKTLTVHIPSSAQWNERTPEELTASLQMFRQLKSPSCPHPIRFSLLLPDPEVSGTPSSLLRTAIQDAAEALSGVLQLSDEVPLGAHPKITISNDMLIVDLAGLRSITLHLEEPYPKGLVTTKLPHDVLTAVAFVLAKAGHFNEASEIASSHLDQGTLARNPDVFFTLVGAMARSRRVPDALRLARKLLRSAAGPQLAQWLVIVVRARTGSLQDSELEYLQQVMKMFIERATELGDARLLGTAHYNLGNYFRGQGASPGLHSLNIVSLPSRSLGICRVPTSGRRSLASCTVSVISGGLQMPMRKLSRLAVRASVSPSAQIPKCLSEVAQHTGVESRQFSEIREIAGSYVSQLRSRRALLSIPRSSTMR